MEKMVRELAVGYRRNEESRHVLLALLILQRLQRQSGSRRQLLSNPIPATTKWEFNSLGLLVFGNNCPRLASIPAGMEWGREGM